MTTEEILKAATPRPWRLAQPLDGKTYIYGAGFTAPLVIPNASQTKTHPVPWRNNMPLIVLAVNSYEKQRDCISGLITVARQVVNTFWETYEYRDKYADNDCTKALEHLEAAVARAEELLK